MKSQERVNILSLDVTARLHMTVRWPSRLPPTAIRLLSVTPTGERHSEDVTNKLKVRGGRPVYTVELQMPEHRGMTTIEWDW